MDTLAVLVVVLLLLTSSSSSSSSSSMIMNVSNPLCSSERNIASSSPIKSYASTTHVACFKQMQENITTITNHHNHRQHHL
jgi:hypothetical protein